MSKISKPSMVKSILVILVVFLMSAGAFIGAAENGSNPIESEAVEALIPEISVVEETSDELEESTYDIDGIKTETIEGIGPGFFDPGFNEVVPIVPDVMPGEVSDEYSKDLPLELDEATGISLIKPSQNEMQDVISYGSSKNTLSDAMSYITETKDEPEEPESTSETDATVTSDETTTRSRAGPLNMIIGTHNTQYAGVGHGYLYRSSSTYYSYDNYAMYNYQSGTTTEYHGFGVYDLRDLAKYTGVKITSGQIVYQQDYRYYAASQDFWTMKSIPNDGASGSLAQGWFNEVGGTGSVKLASETFGSASNMNNFRHTLPITSGGITEINNRLSSNNYDFTIGGDITSFWTGYTYGYIYCLDVRLYLNFTYTDMPMETPNQVAVGDELSGYAYSSTMYDIGRMYTYYGGFAVWNASVIKSLLPTKGPEGEPIELTGISVQVNCPYGYYQYFSIYDMTYDPRDYISSPNTVYTDATGGTRYFNYDKAGTYVSTAREFRWDLNVAALEDFNETLDGDPDFFALGFTQTVNYMYLYSPMLIVKWRIVYPPTKTIQLGADNPEKDGHAMGYIYQSGSSYVCFANYYSYPYYYVSGSTIYDYHGFAEFDLQDLTRWPGVKVKKVSLVVHNYNMYYFDTVNFTAMKTAPYEGAPTSVLASAYTESGSGGTIIGGYQLTTGTDSTYRTIEIELNKAAATAVNNTLSGSPKYYSFGVGMFVQSLQSGRTSGYARWNDVRLKVTFEYEDDMDPTTKGDGIAFGDDWSGQVNKYTSTENRPYGFMFINIDKSTEDRGYAHWEINKIANVFPEENFSRLEIKKVGVRFNHYSGNPSAINLYHMKYNASDSSVTADNLFADCGDGTKYYGPSTGTSVSDTEFEWDLGKDAVKDFQDAFEDNDPTFFGIGWARTTTSSSYDFSPKLVLEWTIPPPDVMVELAKPPKGYEMSPVFFDASPSKNVSGGNGALRFEWDWDPVGMAGYGIFDEVSTSPYAQYTWPDGPEVINITLRVNDTDTGKNSSREFSVMVLNANPSVNTTKGEIGPLPIYEAESCGFEGFTVEDPAGVNDTYWYFWDFDGDLEYDVTGPCDKFSIPKEVWYYDDDFQGEASLLVVDEDGGSTNLTFPKHYDALPPTTYGTGYVYSASQSYYVYFGNPTVEWQYSDDYRRGWAQFDLSGVEQGAVIDKVVFEGTVSSDTNVDLVGVHYMDEDPITYVSSYSEDVWDAAEDGPKIFDISWSVGSVKEDITDFVESPEGQEMADKIEKGELLAIGFDYEKPDPSFAVNEGSLDGYSFGEPILSINYHLTAPRYLFPIVVKNRPPVINCSDIKISPTTLNEGDNITITNLSFCDKGNDTYEYNISVGDTYWTGWQSLGEWPVPGAGGVLNMIEDFETGTGWPWKPWVTYASGGSVSSTAAHDGDYGFIGTGGWYYRTDVNLGKKGEKITSWSYTTASGRTYMGFGASSSGCWSLVVAPNTGTLIIQANSGYGYSDLISTSVSWTLSKWYYTEIEFLDDSGKVKGSLYDSDGKTFITSVETTISGFSAGGVAIRSFSNLYFDTIMGGMPGGGGGPEEEVWVPNVCSSQAGNSNNVYPFGYPATYPSWRYQQFYPASELKKLDGKAITKVTFRQDESYLRSGTITYNGVEIYLNHLSSSSMSSTFSSNYGTDRTKVFDGSFKFTFTGTSPGEVTIDIDNTFIYYNKYNLVFDVKISTMIAVSTQSYPFDASSGSQSAGMIRVYATSSSASSGSVGSSYGLVTKFTGGGGGGGHPGWGAYGPGCFNVTTALNFTVPDDYPFMGTTQDELNITVWVRDDDDNTFVPGRGIGYLEEPAMVDSGYVYYNNGRKVVVDSDNNIYVVYQKYITTPTTQYQIYVAKSKDNGLNWEPYLVTNQWYFTYYSYYPSITIDSNDVLHVAWSGGTSVSTTYNIRYANSKDGGITWGDHYNITEATSYYHYYPSITCDNDDKIHIAWYGMDNSTYYYNVHYINRSVEGFWGPRVMVTTWPYSSPYMSTNRVSAETDSKGNVHIVWMGYIETTKLAYNIGYKVHWAANDTWSNIIPLTSETGYYKYYPVITIDENDDIHVVWYGTDASYSNPNTMYRMYDSSTSTWSPLEYLTDTYYQYDPTIGFNQKGEVDALWYGYRIPSLTTPYVIHHAQKSTTGWTEDYNLVSSGSTNYYPNIMCSPPNSIAEEGFAFVYYDGSVRYWTSRDFRMGNPEYLSGIDWCNGSVLVKNVEPKINLTVMGVMSNADEQEEFKLKLFFDDPGFLATTEIFETKIDWGDGNIDDWTEFSPYPVEELLKGRNPETGEAEKLLQGEHSFKDKPITYLKFQYYQPSYPNYWYINIEGYNMTTNAWEQIFYHYDVYGPSGEFEQSWSTPYYTRWRVECQCYNTEQYTGYYEYEFMVEDFNLTGCYLEIPHKYPDDMPTGTPWDLYDIFIELREDDLGYDNTSFIINVSSVAPTIEAGSIFKIGTSPWTIGKFGPALKFDGVDDYVKIRYDDSLNIKNALTLEAWIYPTNTDTGEHMIVSKGGNWDFTDTQEYELTMDKDRPLIQTKDANTDDWYGAAPANPITKNTWHHIAGVYDGTRFYIYVDGIKQTSLFTGWDVNYKGDYYSKALPTGTHDIHIGRRLPATWGGIYYEGKIDEVAIFNRVLSTAEIQNHMNNGIGGSSLPSGLAGYWSFNEGTGDIAHDSTDYENHGRIYGLEFMEVEGSYLIEEGIPEGTSLRIENFTFDDVAFKEPTENFEYQVDWGDGTVTPWMDDFRFPEAIAGGGAVGGEKILMVTQSSTMQANEKVFYDWLEALCKQNKWKYDYKPWSTSLKFTDYSLVCLMEISNYYRAQSKLIKSNIIDEGVSLYIYGTYADLLLQQLSLGEDARVSYGNFRRMHVVNDYDGITTGYTGNTNYMTGGGSPSGNTIYRYNNFFGGELAAVYSGRLSELIFAVWDSANKSHKFNGATGDMNTGPIGSRIGFFGQTHLAPSPTWLQAWDDMMGRCITWLLEGRGGPQKVEPDVDCAATATNNGRKVVMDSENNLYIIYTNDTGPDKIQISTSDNLGESWSMYQVTTDAASRGQEQLEPSLAIDSKDVLHAVWRGRTNSNSKYNIRYANSADGGKTWGNFKMVTSGSDTSEMHRAPSIVVDSNDKVHITWFGSSASNSAKYNIRYINRTSAGTWGKMAMVTEDTTDMYHQNPAIAVDSTDNVHVVWSGQTSSATVNNIQYRKFDSSTGTWGATEMLTSSSSKNNLNPSIGILPDDFSKWYGENVNAKDSIHVVWDAEPSPTQIKYIKWDPTSETWSSIMDVTDNTYNNTNPSIGFDLRGYVYVAWSKDNKPGINMTVYDGFNWLAEQTIAGSLVKASYPSVMYGGGHSITPRGIAVAFTGDENGTACNLYLSTTSDFNLTDFGTWHGLPRFEHIYRDDKPSATMQDLYNLKIRVRDDDLVVGEYEIPLIVHNVWPILEKDELILELDGDENMLYTSEVKFMDMGTGPAETWNYWLDVDNSESMTEHDLTGKVTTTTEIGDKTYGTIPPIKTPFNDEYLGTVGLYLYDDDISEPAMYMNYSEKITSNAEIVNAETNTGMSSATAYNNGRNVVVDSKGNLYALSFHPGTTSYYDIWCSVSKDMGATWNTYEVTTDTASNNQHQYYPSLAIDSNDVLHVVWDAYYPVSSPYQSRYTLRYANSYDGGKTWGNFNVVALGVYRSRTYTSGDDYYYYNYEENPSLAIDSNNVVHVTWRHYLYKYNYTSSSATYEYGIKYTNNSGGSFGTPQDVLFWSGSSSPYQYQYAPSISVDTMDNVHIAWYGYHSSASTSIYNILYRKLDAVSGWGSITPITTETSSSTYAGYRPCITADNSDNLHVVWYQRTSGGSYYEVRYCMYDSVTSSWGSIEDITSGSSYYQYYPSVGTDARGYIYVAWFGGTASPYKIYMAKKIPIIGTWGEHELITADSSVYTSYQYYPSTLDFNSNGFPYEGMAVVWSGYASGQYNTMLYPTDDFFAGMTVEKTDFKVKFDVTVKNVEPNIVMPDKVEFLPDETVKLPIHLSDQGSDDLYFTIDWGDIGVGSGPLEVHKWYNNDKWPEPGYDVLTGKIHSALNGTAPFMVDPELYHKYFTPGKFMINMTIWDDDEWNWGMTGHNYSIPVEVLSPYRIKEVVVRELEKLLPGRLGYVGYEALKLRYVGEIDPTLLVYNYISRPPYFWETELIMSVCNVMPNSTIFINASFLDEGHFGDKLILKLYNESCGVIDVAEIPTVYTCLEPLKINQRYGDYVVEDFTLKEGMIYHHYSQFAVKTEDALDHVLRSINRDPRRGYGWWHQYWAWWCGYTFYRDLWVDDMRLDPQFGQVVFCEERAAVLDLMEVLKNCLDPKGVYELTMKYTGGSYGCSKVDVEIYFLSDFWWGGWKWYDAAYDLMLGESFTINAANLSSGKLPDRVMFRIYHATTGKLLDTIYIRTSGEWFLEVEPGNLYGDFTITSSTLIVGNDTEWDDWWGGDSDWWDYFFGFWYWEQEEYRSGCGWIVEGCLDEDAAREEQTRICTNLTIIKQLINMLVKADDMLARVAYFDAENMTVRNASNEDEYMYHYKWSKRYWYRGYDSYKKGRPHRAISDFKIAWRHAILATKYSILNPTDPTPGSEMHDPCGDCPKGPTACGLEECEQVVETPWWMHWYFSWCTCMSNCASHKEHCGCGCHC